MPPLFHRESGPEDGPAVLLVHGYPESSYMWRGVLEPLGEAGFRALAPDLPGFGNSPPEPPGTWERHVAALEEFRQRQEIESAALVAHDWGGLIGLRWACDHPDAVWALAVSASAFWADSRWHGLGDQLRRFGPGEEFVDSVTRESFGELLQSFSTGIDQDAIDDYFKAFGDEKRRRGQLELYRSGDFDKLAPYEGKLATLGLPFLALWGAQDTFSSPRNAERFAREVPGARAVVLDGVGHFLFEDAPERCADELVRFLVRADTER